MPDYMAPREGPVVIGANGFVVVPVKQNNASKVWLVEQVTATVGPKTTNGTLGIFKNNFPIGPAAVLSPIVTPLNVNAVGQTFAGEPYVPLGASDELEVVLAGCTAGDQVTVRVQYKEFDHNDPRIAGVF